MSVYFIQAGEAGPIKIGFAKCVASRMRMLQTGSAEQLTLLGHIDGGSTHEAVLHSLLKSHRVRGEWFSAHPDVLALVGEAIRGEIDFASHRPLPVKAPRTQSEMLQARKALGLSQVQLAQRLGITQGTVSRFENGSMPIDRRTSLALENLQMSAAHKLFPFGTAA